jgi:hypothetical protein
MGNLSNGFMRIVNGGARMLAYVRFLSQTYAAQC